ncbi:unnamed protein product [Peniophora sp. CBMAI 1063]|nr:unnamed protein product [Peniophora sp. CBMAI 1063]
MSVRYARLLAECIPNHDYFTDILTALLSVGLIISYLPQHYRIISKNSSEGFSPLFLLLGATGSASGMLNMIVMQWGVLKCCDVYSAADCLETVGGVIQVGLQWALFNITQILYILYFPVHLKYVTARTSDGAPVRTKAKTSSWSLSITLSWVVLLHVLLETFATAILLSGSPHSPDSSVRSEQLELWATFLGISSGVLVVFQYAPQIWHTYKMRLVGALSIPMMLMQTPGGFAMALSIILRPGTNWTSWLQFVVAAGMQAILLTLCICWKVRQNRLHIDDFGRPLPPDVMVTAASPAPDEPASVQARIEAAMDERAPLLGPEGVRVHPAKPIDPEGKKRKWWWFG